MAENDSKIRRKVEQWFMRDEEKEVFLEERFGEGHQNNSKTGKKLRKWLTDDERQKGYHFIEERLAVRHKILMLTTQRAILFEAAFFGRLKDRSDKMWQQFISIHLTEGAFYSALDLYFFRYHDSLFYHNPYKDNTPHKEDNNFKIIHWNLKKLEKKQARKFYAMLKEKELFWKKERRSEQMKILPSGPPLAKPPGKPLG